MRRQNWTYRKIGNYFNITRQRVHQILNKKSCQEFNFINPDLKDWCINNGIETTKTNITCLTNMPNCQRERIRELVRIRDNYTCQLCGKKWKEKKRRFDVHHLDNDKEKSRQCDKLDETDNMLTLCHKCHMNLPAHRNSIRRGILAINKIGE